MHAKMHYKACGEALRHDSPLVLIDNVSTCVLLGPEIDLQDGVCL